MKHSLYASCQISITGNNEIQKLTRDSYKHERKQNKQIDITGEKNRKINR